MTKTLLPAPRLAVATCVAEEGIMTWKEWFGVAFAYGWFVRSSHAGLGNLVLKATPNLREGIRIALLRYVPLAAMLPILLLVVRLGTAWTFLVVLAAFALSLLQQSRIPPADVQFFEKGLAGSLKPRDPLLLATPVRQIVRYEAVQRAEVERNGDLVVTVRDAKTLRSRTWVAAIPPSRRHDVSVLVPLITRHPTGIRSEDLGVRSAVGKEPGPDKPGTGW